MDFEQYNKEKTKEKQDNLAASNKVYAETLELAQRHGWKLFKKSWYHFQLFHLTKGWLYNLYPSNQRIWADPKHGGKFISGITRPWTLLDVVNEAIKLKD